MPNVFSIHSVFNIHAGLTPSLPAACTALTIYLNLTNPAKTLDYAFKGRGLVQRHVRVLII